MPPDPALVALLAASALHLGFQLTVSLVVYPALARVPDWEQAHHQHTRSITPLVVVVYGAVVLASAAALLAAREGAVLAAVAGNGLALAVTAIVAGPTHGRLAAGRDERLLRRLLRADRVRTAGAALAVAAAVLSL